MVWVSPVFSVSPGTAAARILSSNFTTKPPYSHSLFVYDKITDLLQRRFGVIAAGGREPRCGDGNLEAGKRKFGFQIIK